MSFSPLLLLTVISVSGCATENQEATLLDIPNEAKEVQYINSKDGQISELLFKVSKPQHDKSSGAAIFNQLQQQPFTACEKNTSKWVRVSSMDRNESEKNHKFVWFLKMEDEHALVTIAINQTCSAGKELCDQLISTRITRFPWWMVTRSKHIKDICG